MSTPAHWSKAADASEVPFVAYPAIGHHGTIGDRRTAALVAADGTLDWLCLPTYDGDIVFGALLDARRGGFWRLAPATRVAGAQRYLEHSAGVLTTWETAISKLELADIMTMPETKRADGSNEQRVLIRRLRCTKGTVRAAMSLVPRLNFEFGATATTTRGKDSGDDAAGAQLQIGPHALALWTSRPLSQLPVPRATYAEAADAGVGVESEWTLHAGDEVWAVLSLGESPERWSTERAHRLFESADRYWRDWWDSITYTGPRGDRMRRSALTIHLLSYAPCGSLVAAPTTSLPEHIGGPRNYDYRFAWIRDASLSLAILSLLGRTDAAQSYMDWLASLGSSTPSPLQVVYGIDGRTDLTQREFADVYGYRSSLPVRLGNHAFQQRQLDSLGYLADCALVYLEHGGRWKPAYWDLVRRAAQYVQVHWREPDNGIWELTHEAQYVSSKVMSWVTLDRAVKIAQRIEHKGHNGRAAGTGQAGQAKDRRQRTPDGGHQDTRTTGHTAPDADGLDTWRATMQAIHDEVMARGWSERLGAFRQHYDGEGLDASVLLIPLMGFLSADHPRVRSTVEAIERHLTVNGLVHRFAPAKTPGEPDEPLEDFEGAFLPCTFWLASVYAQMGHLHHAEAILQQVEALAGELGIFAEEADARDGTFLGNTPLLFAQTEYARAILEIASRHPLDKARLALGALENRFEHRLGGEA